MFTLVSGVYRWLFSRPELCILLVGLQGSGKTTFFEQLKERYAKNGSKGARGLSALENKSRQRSQDDQGSQRQHERQQLQGKSQQGRQQHMVTQEQNPQPVCKPHEDNQHGGEYQRRELRNHCNQQQHLVRNPNALECAGTDETARHTCPLPRVSSTTGLNYCRFRYDGVDVVLWDLAGVASFHAIWVDYYQNAHCVLYFVDSTSSVEGLKESRAALSSLTSAAVTVLRKEAREQKHGVFPPPLLTVAAKQDLAGTSMSSVQAVFSCDDENCCKGSSSAGAQGKQSHHTHDREDFSSYCPQQRCPVGALLSHSACSLDSVEKVLQCAVHAAKAYNEFLSLSLQEGNLGVPTHDTSNEEVSRGDARPQRRCTGSAELDGLYAKKVPSHKAYRLLQNSRSWPVYSGRRRRSFVASESTRVLPPGTQKRNLTELNGEEPSGCQPVDLGAELRSVRDIVEVPCCHYAMTSATFAVASSGSGNAAALHTSQTSTLESSQETTGPKIAFACTAACRDILVTSAYQSSDTSVPFFVAAAQQTCERRSRWSSPALDREAEVKREYSGLYELDDC